jgi:hypothetical protein
VHDDTFVLPVTVGEIEAAQKYAHDATYSVFHVTGELGFTQEALGLAEWLMTVHRPEMGVDPRNSTASAEWDESTEEGRYRSETFDRLLKDEWLPGYEGGSGYDGPRAGFPIAMVFAAGTRGLSLAGDVVASILHRRICEKWVRTHKKPTDWDEREARRAELPKSQYIARKWSRPALPRWCESEEALLDTHRRLLEKYGPLFLADELYEPSQAGVLDRVFERVKDVFRLGDAWATPIKNFVDRKEIVKTSEIDDHLRALGLVTGSVTPQQYQRVYRILSQLDWCKTDRIVDRRKTKVWVKASCAEKGDEK